MLSSRKPESRDGVFLEGDEVVLANGTYTGTPGVFLRPTADTKWVEIRERNGRVRSHPLEWLAHAGIEAQAGSAPLPNAASSEAKESA